MVSFIFRRSPALVSLNRFFFPIRPFIRLAVHVQTYSQSSSNNENISIYLFLLRVEDYAYFGPRVFFFVFFSRTS